MSDIIIKAFSWQWPSWWSWDLIWPSSSVDWELALFNSTTGKLIKRATSTWIIKTTNWVIWTAISWTDYLAPWTTTWDVPDSLNKRYVTDANLTTIWNTSWTNTWNQNLFSTIAVAWQSNIVADAASDTLTLVAWTNVTITTDAWTDTITINSTWWWWWWWSWDVVWPASATDNAVVRFDSTTWKLIQNSAVTIADTTWDITWWKYNTVAISWTSTPTLAVTWTTTVSWANTWDQTNISWNAATVTTNANLSWHITSIWNTTSLWSFSLSQLNTALSDADVATWWWTATWSNTWD